MITRRWNLLLTLFSLIGGGIGFYVGEICLSLWEGKLHPTLLMGIYFGQFAFFVALLCLIAEMISPGLNGRNWRLKYAGDGWKLLFPSSLVLCFVTGVALQFLYGLTFETRKPADDFVLAIDISGSMNETDPNKESLKAADALLQKMDESRRASVILFNHEATVPAPLEAMTAEHKQQASNAMKGMGLREGGTNIGLALQEAAAQLAGGENVAGVPNARERQGSVILLSDGYSEVELGDALKPFKDSRVAVHTIGMMPLRDPGTALLQEISDQTGGVYHHVARSDEVEPALNKIYANQYDAHLMGERLGFLKNSPLKAVLRIVFIAIIGILLGLSLGMIFDNRHLAKSFAIGGTIAGLLAGAVLEFGLRNTADPAVERLFADLILAVVLSLSTAVVGVKPTEQYTAGNPYDSGGSAPAGSGMARERNTGGHFGL